MLAQAAVFSFANDENMHKNHDDLIEDELTQLGVRRYLGKHFGIFRIRQGVKPDFLLRLQDMGISDMALFQGLDGVGGSVSEVVKLEAYAERKRQAEQGKAPEQDPNG